MVCEISGDVWWSATDPWYAEYVVYMSVVAPGELGIGIGSEES
jgi:hypothetical protein